MAVWRSQPAGDRLLNRRDWALASVVVWLGTVPLGLGLAGLAYLASAGVSPPDPVELPRLLVALYLLGYLLIFSPILSWVGVLLALAPVWWLLRNGAGGWGSFAALGLGAGGVAGALFHGVVIAAAWGLLAALCFRRILFLRRPGIFTSC